MTVDRNGWVIEIRRGGGNPRHLELSPGSTLDPTSIGMLGQWRVEADGMLDVHAFVYFDGTTLYVQSADARAAVRVNGRPVGTSWAPIAPPCTLALGDARLVFCPASQASTVSAAPVAARPAAGRAAFDDSAPTMADVRPEYDADLPTTRQAGPPARPARPARPAPQAAPRVVVADEDATNDIPIPPSPPQASRQPTPRHSADRPQPAPAEPVNEDDETTRALPLPSAVLPGGALAPAPPAQHAAVLAQKAPIAAPAPIMAPPAPVPMFDAAAPGPIAAPPPAAPVEAKPKPLDQLKEQWRSASLPKKAIVLLLPLAFVMVVFGLDDDAPTPRAKAPPAAASAEPSAAATASAKATKPDYDDEVVEPEPPKAPKPKASAAPSAAPGPTAKPPAPAASVKTAERVAIDAVVAGSYEPAAKMYDELAKTHPENPAYKEAARILRAKAKKK